MTLLEIVQDILSDMESDEVNSFDDTVEGIQVAQIVRSTYFAMISNRNWPHTRKAISLVPSNTPDRPTHMRIDDSVKEVLFINYNVEGKDTGRLQFKEVKWLEPDNFLRYTNSRNSSDTNVKVVEDPSGIQLLIIKDKAPQFYTSFDDKHVVFDSFDEEVDNTLQESKVQAAGYVIPDWQHVDSFIPDLPVEAFPALLEEAKSKAMFKLKQFQDVKAEQEASRQQRWLSRKAWSVKGGIQYPNYGRKGVK